MYTDNRIIIGKSGDEEIGFMPKMANRHGLIAGATGTGKTTTLKVLAESFCECGVPVFLADVKGDISGLSKEFPLNFWDVYGRAGLPLRTTISEMGPLILAHILELNDTQSDILKVIFKIADDEGLLLLDSKDLKEMLLFVSENSKDFSAAYGNMSKQSIAAIIRSVIALEEEGADLFFGEPALDINDWFATNSGKGYIQVLNCKELITNPKMYAAFMLWMISELYENLPEVGDLEKPKMVFFFDEAHLLFNSAPASLIQKIIQVVKLIRSKGIGLYFISQSPMDVPEEILGQLGNKIQHALHAYTPAELKKAKAVADSYRANPDFNTYEVLTTMGIGEALVSFLDEGGVPQIVRKCKVDLPKSVSDNLSIDEIVSETKGSPLYGKYAQSIDRESAYEMLIARKVSDEVTDVNASEATDNTSTQKPSKETKTTGGGIQNKEVKKAAKSVATTTAGTIGREIGKSLGAGGGKFGKRLGGNVGAALGRGILNTLFKM